MGHYTSRPLTAERIASLDRAAMVRTSREPPAARATRAHPLLLEVSAWPWLERLSRRHGRRVTLASVPGDDWDRLAAHAFDLIYLMGVWQRSAIGRDVARRHHGLIGGYTAALPGWTAADVVGSPYSIREYVPDDRMGGWTGLDAAQRELGARGVGLVLDFVPNHTGFDHPWIAAHPDRYVRGTPAHLHQRPGEFRRAGGRIFAHGRDPYFPPWTDVAQLNYFNPETRAAMAGELRQLARHCDGVRCDMAMLILNDVFERTWRATLGDQWPRPATEFWPEAIGSAPNLLFVAEVYWDLEWTLQQQGFQFTYDKRLLDWLHAGAADAVRGHLNAAPAYRDRLVRFLENHDEARSAAVFGPRLPAAAVLFATQPGLRFYFDGQLEGAGVRTPIQLARWPEEPVNERVRSLYERILRATNDALFHDGEWRLVDVSSEAGESCENLIAWQWRLGNRVALAVVNLGSSEARGFVAPEGDRAGARAHTFLNVLTDRPHELSSGPLRRHGVHARLAAGEAWLLLGEVET
jgi:hypothetical protein